MQASLQEFAASGTVEVRENGGRVASFSGMSWEVRGTGEKPLLPIWSEEFNLTRRVLAITNHSDEQLALAVERFGRSKPDRLEFIRMEFERKACEHIHLPLQGADYWLRIRRHLKSGDIARSGYFPGIELQPAPPLVYLVAPALRFHLSTDDLFRYLSPELEVVRIGLAECWRRGLRVVMWQ